MLKDFGDWLCAVFNNWAGYSTGGVILATVGFWHMWRDKPMRRKTALVLSACFLILALFKAWEDQHKRVKTLNPDLTLSRREQREMVSELAKTKGSVQIQVWAADRETCEFGEELQRIFAQANWNVSSGGCSNGTGEGIRVFSRDINTPSVALIQHLLLQSHIHFFSYKKESDPQNPSTILIKIGEQYQN